MGRRLLSVGGLLPFALAAGSAAAAERLDEAEITASFTGMTLAGIYDGEGGGQFSEMYIDNGAVSYFDAKGFFTGTWDVRNGTLCTFYDGMEGGCFAVERESENCFVFLAAATGKGKTASDNGEVIARGWDSASPSTCEGVAAPESPPQPRPKA